LNERSCRIASGYSCCTCRTELVLMCLRACMSTCVRVRDSRDRKWNIDEGVRNILRSENSQDLVLIWEPLRLFGNQEIEAVYHANILLRKEKRLHFFRVEAIFRRYLMSSTLPANRPEFQKVYFVILLFYIKSHKP